MGHFKDTTVEITFNGIKVRVSQGVANSLKKSGKLGQSNKKTKAKKEEK